VEFRRYLLRFTHMIDGSNRLRGIMLRGMDWTSIQSDCIRQIEDMIRELCRSDLFEVRLSH
jgi:hypothetical protein